MKQATIIVLSVIFLIILCCLSFSLMTLNDKNAFFSMIGLISVGSKIYFVKTDLI